MDITFIKNNKKIIVECLIFLFIIIYLILINYFCLGFAKFGIETPLSYSGLDDFTQAVRIKTLVESGWVFENNKIGVPYGTTFYDFPPDLLQNVEYIGFKIINFFTKDIYAIFNIYYLFSSAFCGIIAYIVLRLFKLNIFVSSIGAIIYGLSPYFYSRGMYHFCLGACYFVPLSILLCLWASNLREKRLEKHSNAVIAFFSDHRNIFVIFFSFLIANNGIGYYAFFTCFFLSLVGLDNYLKTRKIISLKKPCIMIFFILFFMVISLIPKIIYEIRNGNINIEQRSIANLEYYGLKITQLFIPTTQHFLDITKINQLVSNYNTGTPLVNENKFAYMGVFSCVGLIISLLSPIGFNSAKKNYYYNYLIPKLIVGAFLFFTIGGLISLFCLIMQINSLRGFNRVSIFIEFLSIISLCYYLQKAMKHIKRKMEKYLFMLLNIFIILFIIFCFYEQTPSISTNISSRFEAKNNKECDSIFISEIEHKLQDNDAVFQLPYHPYPESGPIKGMNDYHLFAGYINSTKLRWSYGGIKGRKSDSWNKVVSYLPIEEMIPAIVQSGFRGIYIDTRAYEDEEIKLLCDKIEKELNYEKPLISENNYLLFYNLYPYLSHHPEYLNKGIFDFEYLPCKVGKHIMFDSVSKNTRLYMDYGFSKPEGDYTWTDGKEAKLKFKLEIPEGEEVQCFFNLAGIFNRKQQILVFLNNQIVFDKKIDNNNDLKFNFVCPRFGLIDLTLKFPDAISPYTLGMSGDTRELALAINNIIFMDKSCESSLIIKPELLNYKIGTLLSFCKAHGASGNKYLISGFSDAESTHTWTDGKKAEMGFVIEDIRGDLECTLNYETFNGKQPVKISANSQMIIEYVANGIENKSFIIPKDVIGIDKKLLLQFELSGAHSPALLGQSDDPRELALAMKSIIIRANR